ncbi:hypothetical protein, conserved [Leishmania tarentolae]|uniref:Uncharacterized protein n=1 Tax=Leishmania tarentolae TaxID=5689 RepID=A0A640KHA6_LEITA|nr:hypothetical protein, conserved [Leishmania tarentolae]
MADAADTLLLQLEVEAAAARNAELSQTIEVLQAEILRLRRANASLFPCVEEDAKASLQTVAGPSATRDVCRDELSAASDARAAFVILDDLLFEMADIRSRVCPEDRVDLTPRSFTAETTVTAHATRCLAEARKLKEALTVKQHSTVLQVSELQRALGEQAEANRKQTSAFGLKCTMLEQKYAALKRKYDEAVSRQGDWRLDRVGPSSPPPSLRN